MQKRTLADVEENNSNTTVARQVIKSKKGAKFNQGTNQLGYCDEEDETIADSDKAITPQQQFYNPQDRPSDIFGLKNRNETKTATRLIRIALVNAKCLGSDTLNFMIQIYNQHL